MKNDVGQDLRKRVAERAYHVCEYCLIHEEDVFWGFEVDHVISRKHGGPTHFDNLAWTCVSCNRNKGTDIATMSGSSPKLTALFHPRRDAWSEHFLLQQIRIEGLSPTGKGTATLLKLNDDTHLKERFYLQSVGRYPTMEALARMKD
jgi:hypothetical protein